MKRAIKVSDQTLGTMGTIEGKRRSSSSMYRHSADTANMREDLIEPADSPMEARSILARKMAYAVYGWTDEEFCDEQDPDSGFDRLTFLQCADVAIDALTQRIEKAKAGALRGAAVDFRDTDQDGPEDWLDVDDWLEQRADAIEKGTDR